MHAGIIYAKFEPKHLGDMIRFWKEEFIPLMQEAKGLETAYLLTDAEDGSIVSMGLWKTQEEAKAFGDSSEFEEILERISEMAIEEPVRVMYDVSASYQHSPAHFI